MSTLISQGSVATYLRRGEIFSRFLLQKNANELMSLPVRELRKSVNIWWSYEVLV